MTRTQPFVLTDWYRKADDERLFSSARGKAVSASDPDYVAWAAVGRLPTAWPRDVPVPRRTRPCKPFSLPMTKRLDAVFVAGTGKGGLDTGTKAASTAYHLWLIGNVATRAVDVLFSTSAAAPTLPSGYTAKRYL